MKLQISDLKGDILPSSSRKIQRATDLFAKYVDTTALMQFVAKERETIVTPRLFEHQLLQKAASNKMRIVFPEPEDPRYINDDELTASLHEELLTHSLS